MQPSTHGDISRALATPAPGVPPSTQPDRSVTTSIESFTFSLDPTSAPLPQPHVTLESYEFPAIIERYRLENLLGRGGFGEVWKALDLQAQKYVAIKGPRTDRRVTPELIGLFLSEAEKAREMAGTSVVPVLQVVQAPSLREHEFLCFIVMQWMEGGSLAEKFKRGERPTAIQAVEWVASLADGLAQIHSHGYIHRDIKPDNILFDAAGRPYFSDFGLAASDLDQLAEDRAVRGTVAYMSPEQAREQRVDRQADIYSLGVVLYQLLALPYVSQSRLALPYLASSSLEYLQMLGDPNQQVRALPEGVPNALAQIVEQRCLIGDKSHRYRSAQDFSRDLRNWLRSASWTRRRMLLIGAGLGAVAIAAGGIGAWKFGGGQQANQLAALTLPVNKGAQNRTLSEPVIRVVNLLERTSPHPADWSVDDQLTTLSVHTSDRVLISYGAHDKNSVVFEITFSQEQRPSQLGVFFGHYKASETVYSYYQAIKLIQLLDGSVLLRTSSHEFVTQNPRGIHTEDQIGEWAVEQLLPEANTLRIQLSGGQLAALAFNNFDLTPELVQPWTMSRRGRFAAAQGDFGAFASDGPGKFTDAKLNTKSLLIRQ